MVRFASIGGAVACPSCQTLGRGNTGVGLMRTPALALCAALTRPCHVLTHSSVWAVRPLAAGEPLPRTLASCCIGSGCPSFGGQRTARSTRKALRSRVFGASLVGETELQHQTRSLVPLVILAVCCSVGLPGQYKQPLARAVDSRRASAHECNARFRCPRRSCWSWRYA